MKVVLLGNQARAMSNFWTVFIRKLLAAGHDVICLVPETLPGDDLVWEKYLLDTGARIAHYPLDRKGLNPVRDLGTLRSITAFFANEKPDCLFAFTIKPVIYGAIAAMLARSPARDGRHLMITGLGYMFEADSPVKKILTVVASLLYKLAFSLAGTVYFQNTDDRRLFDTLSISQKAKTVRMTRGTGVDIERFIIQPPATGSCSFLFVGRLIEAKGIGDFCEAAALLKIKYPEVEFLVLGPEEKGRGSYPLSLIAEWEQKGVIRYLGETDDVRPFLARARAVVLPSWREGTPCSLMEAMATARAVVAADAPGSREVVMHGENGFLVPVQDAKALAAALETLVIDPDLAINMGKAGRQLMESGFSADQVANALMASMSL